MLRINSDGTIPTDNPFFRSRPPASNRRDLGAGPAQPVHVRRPAGHRAHVHQRRRPEQLGGDQRWDRGRELRLAERPKDRRRIRASRARSTAYGHGRARPTAARSPGGAFYNPPTGQFPGSYVGNYFFADYCSGWIRRMDPSAGNAVSAFASGWPRRSISKWVTTASSITWRVAEAPTRRRLRYPSRIRAAEHHESPLQPHRHRRRFRHIRRDGVGDTSPEISVAAQRRRSSGATVSSYTIAQANRPTPARAFTPSSPTISAARRATTPL